jgi:hypothetical protein
MFSNQSKLFNQSNIVYCFFFHVFKSIKVVEMNELPERDDTYQLFAWRCCCSDAPLFAAKICKPEALLSFST